MPNGTRNPAGQLAEQAAALHLSAAGLTLLERNFRCRAGEIDLVFLDRDILVFIEVRLRSSERFGGALGSVDARKQRRLYRAARRFVAARGVALQTPIRFDVIAVRGEPPHHCHFEWIRDAFQFD
ncbi:MAG: YraN family protein [Pseudomonadota bacterium]